MTDIEPKDETGKDVLEDEDLEDVTGGVFTMPGSQAPEGRRPLQPEQP